MKEYRLKVRPQAPKEETRNQVNAAKIFLNNAIFTELGMSAGHVCIVGSAGGAKREAIAWPPRDKGVDANVGLFSTDLRASAGLTLGDSVSITAGGPVPDAETVEVRDVTEDLPPLTAKESTGWEWFLEGRLEASEYVMPGLTFKELSGKGPKRNFIVSTVNGRNDSVAKCGPSTIVQLVDDGHVNSGPVKLEVAEVSGLHKQVAELNSFLEDFSLEFGSDGFESPSCGLVIEGGHGTGKSMLIDRIAATGWGTVARIDDTTKPTVIQGYFDKAGEQRKPSMILIDDLQMLTGRDQPNRNGVIRAIAKGLDALASRAQSSGKKPDVVVVATCLDYFEDVPYALRKAMRFSEYISLPIPDGKARKEIVRSFNPRFPQEQYEEYLSDLSDQTHAYTAEDLMKLLFRAAKLSRNRVKLAGAKEPLSWEDLKGALGDVQPTAMHDIRLKPPTVRWSDIGGYDSVKLALQKALRRPSAARDFMWKPSKGILMYGPPGCSKTMTAQAFATESGFNFFAVKGGELLNMYVGETERSIRNLFKRARDASPSIIFFDEIDSLAGSRSGAGGNAAGGGGVQALTTLLTEMDGFEQLGSVFILAATNRPDMLDSALIRPGRFDQTIYVPLPDEKAREAILAGKARELRFKDIDVGVLAQKTDGYSGAEIAGLCNTAFADLDPDLALDDFQKVDGMAMLEAAIQETPRRITADILSQYDKWHQRFRK